jgi:CBS domain-containing protein
MSPRAAARLASLGFTHVCDYVAGKADWGSAGLPLEGDDPSEHRAGAHARTDVPTCRLDDRLASVRTRVEETAWDTCFVVNDQGVLLGRLGRTALRRDDDVSAEEAMTPGPSTVRPSARLEPMAKRMRERNLTGLPVTTSDGRLIGMLQRGDLEAALSSDQAARSS